MSLIRGTSRFSVVPREYHGVGRAARKHLCNKGQQWVQEERRCGLVLMERVDWRVLSEFSKHICSVHIAKHNTEVWDGQRFTGDPVREESCKSCESVKARAAYDEERLGDGLT